jgi:Fe-S-cluster-containing dehydrogenase component
MAKQGAGEEVLIDDSLCIGCKWCLLVCPFGAVVPGRGKQAVHKCDLCFERAHQGREPACAEHCPTGALQLVAVEIFTKEKRREFLVDYLGREEA